MNRQSDLNERLGSLREAFDASFAAREQAQPAEQLDFLTIRVAGDAYAVRLAEVQSLHADRKVVAAPSLLPALLGVAGFRGVLTPIYDLAPLLGYAQQSAAKWLIVARHAAPVAFAFEVFDAHLRVDSAHVSNAEVAAQGAVRGAVHTGGRAVPLLHLPSLIDEITERIKAYGPTQER